MSARAIKAAKEALAALPEARRAELEARFDLARLQAQQHSEKCHHRIGAAIAAAVLGAALLTAAPAHADDQSYLNYLEAHGQSTTAYPFSPAVLVVIGNAICTNLRAGADPLAGVGPIYRVTRAPVGVEAAQHELCPDTLH